MSVASRTRAGFTTPGDDGWYSLFQRFYHCLLDLIHLWKAEKKKRWHFRIAGKSHFVQDGFGRDPEHNLEPKREGNSPRGAEIPARKLRSEKLGWEKSWG